MRIPALLVLMKQRTKRHILLLVILLASLSSFAQTFTLKGKVTDDEGNALELATVSCIEQAAVTMTNLQGEFKITLRSADSVLVKFSMVGYNAKTRLLRNPKNTQTIQIQLHSMELGGVTLCCFSVIREHLLSKNDSNPCKFSNYQFQHTKHPKK